MRYETLPTHMCTNGPSARCKTVFREVASGAKIDRAELRRLLGQPEAGDVVTVTRSPGPPRLTPDQSQGFQGLGPWSGAGRSPAASG